MRIISLFAFTAFVCMCFCGTADAEILYPSDAFSKLDTFESLNLEDADKLFIEKDYKGAYAAYKAYSYEFAKSKALPYVLLRMGRCLHLLGKRNAAVKAYQDVVDYFPDDVIYAAGALYHIGECHGQNGDDDKKLAVWARMVKDKEYVNQPLSGTALDYLGSAMVKLGKYDDAVEYHWRTAAAFIKTNPKAAETARNSVISHYVTRKPNHEKLSEFYIAVGGFDRHRRKVVKQDEDKRYWSTVMSTALRMSSKSEQKAKVCSYWTAKMGSKFADDDDLRKQWADAMYVHEEDRDKWMSRMEKQFKSKPATIKRVMQWCGYYNFDAKLRSKFFAGQSKSFIKGMSTNEKLSLMKKLNYPHKMHEEAQTIMRSISTRGMSDEEIRSFAEFAANYETEDVVLGHLAKIKDKLFAAKARFDYYHRRRHRNKPFMEKALAEIPALQKSPKYSKDVIWAKAELLQNLGRFEEAIKAYRAANRQPDSTFSATDCMVALKQYGKAIKNVQGLDSVGGATAARACLKVADIYRISGDKGREVQQLRVVLRRYPKSGESSTAHNRLESYGVKVIGGESEAEE